MRKLLLLGALAALATMLVATPASASFDTHFTVRGHHFKLREISDHQIKFTVKLRKNGARVGSARGQCHDVSRRQAVCHIRYRFNGRVGGKGTIGARGRFGKGRERFDVTGGTGDFDGVAGKVILSDDNRSSFHLVS